MGAARAFLDDISRVPPPELKATPEDIRRARELFLDNVMQIMQALLHYSLAGGFARYVGWEIRLYGAES